MEPLQNDDEAVPDISIEPTPIETARRRHGLAGAALMAGMLGMDEALGLRKKKEEAPIVVAAPSDPLDIDEEGIDVPVDEQTSVYAPPQPRSIPTNAKQPSNSRQIRR